MLLSTEMTLFQAIVLGFVQGLTEFLPILSSGHLVILQKYFGLNPPVLFDAMVHVGTLLEVLLFIRQKITDLLSVLWRQEKEAFVLLFRFS